MKIIFPEDVVKVQQVDSMFEDQAACFRQAGHETLVINDRNRIVGVANASECLAIYRGWMMTVDKYGEMYDSLLKQGVRLITDQTQYQLCHYITGWYDHIIGLTAKSVMYDDVSEITTATLPVWGKYFVKDYVKSQTTSRGSMARDIAEIKELVLEIEKYRGFIEGGICVRKFEEYKDGTEERYFVYNNKVFGRKGDSPSLISKVTKSIGCPFYSVDVIESITGEMRIVEIGDGQVSDVKQWDVEQFVEIFK